jgi:integrase
MPKKPKRSKKPYPDFPLFAHAVGQWAKKIRGKTHYFGAVSDPDAALRKYTAERDDLHAGRTPRTRREGLTVRELVNRFLTSKKTLMDSGELSPRTWSHYYGTFERLVEIIGKDRFVTDLASDDFEKLRGELAKGRGAHALSGEVQRIRTLFKYAWEESLIETPVRFGTTFKKPSKKIMRQARHESGPRMLEAADLRKLLAAAGDSVKAMILLGLNAGFGQTDVASLPIAALDLEGGWVNFPRPKTGIARRCPLWPETVEAIRSSLASRSEAKLAEDAGLVFITQRGARWVRVRQQADGKPAVPIDAVNLEFNKLLTAARLKRKGLAFYSLRHIFRTIADAAKDQPAVNAIMGHSDESMAALYRERIDDDRLKAVTDSVRKWLQL